MACDADLYTASMRIHTEITALQGVKRPVLTTGTFDGVHHGHRTILRRLTEIARRENGESMLFTFHPHPRQVLFPGDDALKLLCTYEEKVALLEATGLDHLLVIPFSRDFSRMRASDYVHEVLVSAIGIRAMVVGYDHRFGRNREGDLKLLRRMGGELDFRVEEIAAQEVDHVRVSSTKIRHALLEGDVRTANELLGYRYGLTGVVVKGDQLGRTLGYPTANLGMMDPDKLVPADGIYAVTVELRSGPATGMLYIGHRPTLADGQGHRSIEVHVFDLERELYGETVSVRLVDRIRGDMRFDGLESLKQQMDKDRIAALHRLAVHP